MRKLRKFAKKYGPKLLTVYGISFIVLAALGVSLIATHTDPLAAIASFNTSTTTVFFRSYGDRTLVTGGTTSIDINVDTKIPINALGATITFPKDTLEIVGISKERSFFDLWTEDTSISEDTGEIHFSGGTTKPGGLMGTGTIITLLVRAKVAGTAQLNFKDIQVYPSDDTGEPVDTATHSITYTIDAATTSNATTASSGGGASITAPATPPVPNPDLNGDGKINLVDLSILVSKMFAPYDSRYDLNLNGSVGLDDLSILLSKM